MLRSYFRSAYQDVHKHPLVSLVHVIGLTLGMTAFLTIGHYVAYEYSYDQRFDQRPLYRVTLQRPTGKGWQGSAQSYSGIGPRAQANLPEVKGYTRLFRRGEVTINVPKGASSNSFLEDKVFFAEPSLLALFSFPLLKGEPATALAEPFTILLSASTARKYFAGLDPVGRTVQLDDQFGQSFYRITGVYEDLPHNSHLQADLFTSYSTLSRYLGPLAEQDWTMGWFYTYLLLSPRAESSAVAAKLGLLLRQHQPPSTGATGYLEAVGIQPVTDIHLHSRLEGELGATGNGSTVQSLLFLGVLILLIAWVNYINLSVARGLERGKEVGIRKTIGASRQNLLQQFLLEAGLQQGVALLLALLLTAGLLPALGDWLDRPLRLNINASLLLVSGGLLVAGTLGAGLYPALLLSSFRPERVLKGKVDYRLGGFSLRKALVVAQFTAAVVLLSGSYVVYQQLHFMQRQPLGITLDQILVVKGPAVHDSLAEQKREAFKAQLLSQTDILGVTSARYLPGTPMEAHQGTIHRLTVPAQSGAIYVNSIDEDFLTTFGIQLLAGRNFSKALAGEEDKVLLSEAASRQLGFAQPGQALNQRLHFPYGGKNHQGGPVTVIGVVKDYHHLTLKEPTTPVVFRRWPSGDFSLKVRPANMAASLEVIKAIFRKHYPKDPFDYHFLSDAFHRQYRGEEQLSLLLGVFAGVAIGIACLGLFALAAFTTLRRTKEVSIHKIHGARIYNLWYLLAKEFLLMVGLAGLLALPIAYGLVSQWIDGFAYRISLHLGLFVLPFVVVGTVALLSILYHVWKVSRSNPTLLLRQE